MTAIEFFDRTPVDNIISSLTTVPEKIIFRGDSKEMREFESVHRSFLKKRNINIQLESCPIRRNNLNDIVGKLSEIVETEDECVFDVTGGEDLALVAMGIVYQKYRDKNIQMQLLNIRNGVVSDCDNDGYVDNTMVPKLSVEELVLINGGKIRYDSDEGFGERTVDWDLNDEFINDVKVMWDICRNDPGYWNTRINVLEQASFLSDPKKSLDVCVNTALLKEHAGNVGVKYAPISGLLKGLSKKGLVLGLKENVEMLSFTFKNDQVKRCLTKAGTILEMIVLVSAVSLKNKDATDYYTDAKNGVYIDWDGVFHKQADCEKDTENEIDVVLMRGVMPIFISCKNGFVGDDELYKLSSVADRFGGPYVKKVLIATYLGKGTKSSEFFKQRAKDMNINLVESVHLLNNEKFCKMIKHLVNS